VVAASQPRTLPPAGQPVAQPAGLVIAGVVMLMAGVLLRWKLGYAHGTCWPWR
jgi:hypothetical protein